MVVRDFISITMCSYRIQIKKNQWGRLKMKSSKLLLTALLGIASISVLASTEAWTYDSTAKTLSWTDSTGFENVVSNVSAKGTSLDIGTNKENPLAVNLDFSVPIEGGYEITTINGLFEKNLSVVRFISPPKLKELKYDRFRFCSNLKEIRLNDGLTTIGTQVFRDCPIEGELYLPKTLTAIGSSSFNSPGIVGKIIWPENCPEFNGLIYTSIDTFIGNGIKSLSNNCLAHNSYLTNVVLSTCLETIKGGDWFDYSYCNLDVYWRSFPANGFAKNPMGGHLYSNTITNHLAWHDREIWRDFASTNTMFTFTVPEDFSSYGKWGSQVTVWWRDPDRAPEPMFLIIR